MREDDCKIINLVPPLGIFEPERSDADEKRLVDAAPIIRSLQAMKTLFVIDAIAIDSMVKALEEAPEVHNEA